MKPFRLWILIFIVHFPFVSFDCFGYILTLVCHVWIKQHIVVVFIHDDANVYGYQWNKKKKKSGTVKILRIAVRVLYSLYSLNRTGCHYTQKWKNVCQLNNKDVEFHASFCKKTLIYYNFIRYKFVYLYQHLKIGWFHSNKSVNIFSPCHSIFPALRANKNGNKKSCMWNTIK